MSCHLPYHYRTTTYSYRVYLCPRAGIHLPYCSIHGVDVTVTRITVHTQINGRSATGFPPYRSRRQRRVRLTAMRTLFSLPGTTPLPPLPSLSHFHTEFKWSSRQQKSLVTVRTHNITDGVQVRAKKNNSQPGQHRKHNKARTLDSLCLTKVCGGRGAAPLPREKQTPVRSTRYHCLASSNKSNESQAIHTSPPGPGSIERRGATNNPKTRERQDQISQKNRSLRV